MSVDKEELIEFWKSPASGSGSSFFKDSSTLQDRAFSTIWLISLENQSGLHDNFTIDVPSDKEIPLNFRSHLHLEPGDGLGIQTDSAWMRSALHECSCFSHVVTFVDL